MLARIKDQCEVLLDTLPLLGLEVTVCSVFREGSWHSVVRVKDVRVFAGPTDAHYYLLQCAVTRLPNSSVSFVYEAAKRRKTSESKGEAETDQDIEARELSHDVELEGPTQPSSHTKHGRAQCLLQ